MKGFELHTLTGADVVVATIYNGHLRVFGSSKDLETAVTNVAANLAKKSTQQAQDRHPAAPQAATVSRPSSYR